ncbi:hypothetical protein CS542_02760 [Pedobacter sp. IW39]|nr:hypothetical protein CS542_02760 [Pedobacter sp. IW39]
MGLQEAENNFRMYTSLWKNTSSNIARVFSAFLPIGKFLKEDLNSVSTDISNDLAKRQADFALCKIKE